MRTGSTAALLISILMLSGCRTPSPQNGAAVFHTNCIGCHSLESGNQSHGPSLAHYFQRRPAPTDAQTGQLIRNGRKFMPAFRDKLSRTQISDLIAYLKTR
jgi:mono/diheme cytochrome c family protein